LALLPEEIDLKLPHVGVVFVERLSEHVRAVVAADKVEIRRVGGRECGLERRLAG